MMERKFWRSPFEHFYQRLRGQRPSEYATCQQCRATVERFRMTYYPSRGWTCVSPEREGACKSTFLARDPLHSHRAATK